MILATVSTGHYTFTALGESRNHADEILKAAYARHAAQTRANEELMWELVVSDEVNYAPIEVGKALRDGEPFRLNSELERGTCIHCGRTIIHDETDGWVDPEATGDDIVWRETCDEHDTFQAEHEPAGEL